MHNICWHHCLNHFSCNISLNIWSLEDWVVLVTSNCGSRTLFVRTLKVFFTFYAPVPGPQSPSFQHFQPHFSARCNSYAFSSLCWEAAASFCKNFLGSNSNATLLPRFLRLCWMCCPSEPVAVDDRQGTSSQYQKSSLELASDTCKAQQIFTKTETAMLYSW